MIVCFPVTVNVTLVISGYPDYSSCKTDQGLGKPKAQLALFLEILYFEIFVVPTIQGSSGQNTVAIGKEPYFHPPHLPLAVAVPETHGRRRAGSTKQEVTE